MEPLYVGQSSVLALEPHNKNTAFKSKTVIEVQSAPDYFFQCFSSIGHRSCSLQARKNGGTYCLEDPICYL